MKFSEFALGRVFVLRLEDGDVLNGTLEAFAADHDVQRALVLYVGGVADGSTLVVGPAKEPANPIRALTHRLSGPQEALAVGTLFPDGQGRPVLHMHAASGREGGASVGCTRAGVHTWLVGEVIVLEILGHQAQRKLDQESGFELLHILRLNE